MHQKPLKGCDLKELLLNGADCTGANFTLTKFTGSDLSGVAMRDCDLEGADLRSVNLENADLRGAALTAAKFTSSRRAANIRGVRFSRKSIEAEGVDEVEHAFLLNPQNGAMVE